MTDDRKAYNKISEASRNTAEPKRVERNLQRFFELNPDNRLSPYLSLTARLFAASQFLANYCIAHPEELYAAMKERKRDITRKLLQTRAKKELVIPLSKEDQTDINALMRSLRLFKKRYLLRITVRDITGETDIQSSMEELTLLAEIVITTALQWSLIHNQKRYGEPPESKISIIALGKLGGEELNYSSDVDLIAVYDATEGETAGVLNPLGIRFNRISTHEFYCRVVELFRKLLSAQTEDGIAYRVDLRLRPQGQKGDIALPLRAYTSYYESWGRTWERMVLIRARPVAGDMKLGKAFLDVIRPFVWRETLDYPEIEEIRGLKKKIDSALDRDDIKRGYGGIREAEFFVQTFQLLFGGMNSSVRSYRILNAVQALKWMKKVPDEDLTTLWENYLFLRRVEHYLQMKEDLQTHRLPSSDEAMEQLARNMGFPSQNAFLGNLRLRRMQIKSMYNSLLGTREDIHAEALNLLEGKLADEEISGYLTFRKVGHPEKCLKIIKGIREQMGAFRTTQERFIARDIIPQLLEDAFAAESPDRALAGLESLLTFYKIKTIHLSAFKEQKELMTGIIRIFSFSTYLTRIFLSSQHYLDMLIEEWRIAKTLRAMAHEVNRVAQKGEDISRLLARHRRFEEVRLGMLFLLKIVKTGDLFKSLSQLAEATVRAIVDRHGCNGLSVVAMGKFGGREMTFGSDMDIIFVSQTPEATTAAEKTLKALTAYTDMGLLYSVDTRLRPDGSRGILVQDVEGYRTYYLNKAKKWELQALLKARPVGGDAELARTFIHMAKDVILTRGCEVTQEDVKTMRRRIIDELARESVGLDVKLGPGGIEEIEFYVQYLQLHHARDHPELLVQNTSAAMNRLAKKKLLSPARRDTLYNTYWYYRKLETFLRLNEEHAIAEAADVTELAAKFMEQKSRETLLEYLRKLRRDILDIINER